MGFRFRKSVNVGPVRFTASKSGISTSFGGKGARVTKTASGRTRTTLSVPGTGISYVSESGSKKKKAAKVSNAAATNKTAQPVPVATTAAPMTAASVRSLGVLILCAGIVLAILFAPLGIAVVGYGIYRIATAKKYAERYNEKLRLSEDEPSGGE